MNINIKYYKVKRDVSELLDVGDRFVCWDGERMYHEKSDTSSSYLSVQILNQHGGFGKYFEECDSFNHPMLNKLINLAQDGIMADRQAIVKLKNQIKEKEKFLSQIK